MSPFDDAGPRRRTRSVSSRQAAIGTGKHPAVKCLGGARRRLACLPCIVLLLATASKDAAHHLHMARTVKSMYLSRAGLTNLLVALAVVASACSNAGSTSTTSPSPAVTTDVLPGIVQPAVNGVPQNSVVTFVVGAISSSGGSVTVTLTSAAETLPGGVPPLTTVSMGVDLGSFANGACTSLTGVTIVSASSTPVYSVTVASAGTYCVRVSDVTIQTGPVTYAVAVSHP